jgi:hypothetical protein
LAFANVVSVATVAAGSAKDVSGLVPAVPPPLHAAAKNASERNAEVTAVLKNAHTLMPSRTRDPIGSRYVLYRAQSLKFYRTDTLSKPNLCTKLLLFVQSCEPNHPKWYGNGTHTVDDGIRLPVKARRVPAW